MLKNINSIVSVYKSIIIVNESIFDGFSHFCTSASLLCNAKSSDSVEINLQSEPFILWFV